MSETLDDDLTGRKTRKASRSPYYSWSNAAASLVIVAALLKILHLPLANLLLHLGVSAHVGIELGFLIVLRGKSSKNRRRVLISPFLLLILTRFDLFSYDESLLVKWGFVVLIIAISAFITYSVIRRKLKELT